MMVQRDSGAMSVVASTGVMALPTVRQRFVDSRVIGMVRQGNRLSMAQWGASSYDIPPLAVMKEIRESGGETARRHGMQAWYSVAVYDLDSGEMMDRTTLTGEEGPTVAFPSEPPAETREAGVMQEKDGKVNVFGRAVKVENGKLVWGDGAAAAKDGGRER